MSGDLGALSASVRLGPLRHERRDKLAARLQTLYSHFDLVYSNHQKGLIDRDLVKRNYSLLYWYRDRKGVQKWWERTGRGQFSSEFVAFVEGPEVTL